MFGDWAGEDDCIQTIMYLMWNKLSLCGSQVCGFGFSEPFEDHVFCSSFENGLFPHLLISTNVIWDWDDMNPPLVNIG